MSTQQNNTDAEKAAADKAAAGRLVADAASQLTEQVAVASYFAKLASYGIKVAADDGPKYRAMGDAVAAAVTAVHGAIKKANSAPINAAVDMAAGVKQAAKQADVVQSYAPEQFMAIPGVREAALVLAATEK